MTDELVRTPPLRELVYERLRDRIVEGRLAPGEHLVETELASQLGVSRGPIREALQLLAQDGWVVLRPRHGAFVRQPKVDEVESYFFVRILIETEAAKLAASSGHGASRGASVDRLDQIISEASGLLDIGDYQGLIRANGSFHAHMVEMTGNEALRQVWDFISRKIRWHFARVTRARGADAWLEHRQIAAAIRLGDPDQASELTRRHIERTQQVYIELS